MSESVKAESVPAGSADDDRAAKNHMVMQFVVENLFTDKKRKLSQLIEKEVCRAEVEPKVLECGCGCSLAPCRKKVVLRDEYRKKVAHKIWPTLEKELIQDVSNALWQSRRSNEWLAKELDTVTKENTVLKLRMAVVASAF